MAPRKKDRLQLKQEHELEVNRMVHGTQRFALAVKAVVWLAGISGAAWCVGQLAGQETTFKGLLEATLTANFSEWVYRSILAVVGVSGWVANSRTKATKNREIENLSSNLKTLERIIDPNRTSSKLDSKGMPKLLPPGDRKK